MKRVSKPQRRILNRERTNRFIEYMIDKILPLFGDEIDTIAWKKDRVTSGYTGDIIAILTHGGKFILFNYSR